MPAADVRLGNCDGTFEIILTPRPATAQGLVRIEPGDWAHALERRVRAEPERRAVVVEDIEPGRLAGRDASAVVHRDAQNRARHVELLGRQCAFLTSRRALDERVVDRETEHVAEPRRRSDAHDVAALIEKLLDRGNRALLADAAEHVLILR